MVAYPRAFVDDNQGRMWCDGDRCSALVGNVGVSTAYAVYGARPDVCKACLPGDEACQTARFRFETALNDRSPDPGPIFRLEVELVPWFYAPDVVPRVNIAHRSVNAKARR